MSINDQYSQEMTTQITLEKIHEGWTPLDVDISGSSHQGKVRENNEDSYLVARFGRSLETLNTNLDSSLLEPSYSVTGHGLLVADGMGGMAAGELASSLALSRLIELVIETSDWVLTINKDKDVRTILQRMTQRFHQIDETLRKEASADPALRGMGTTLTVAANVGSDLFLGHVGDSRAYLLRGTDLRQLTTDHTLAQALIDAGVADQNDPATRSMRHVLTAAIGSLGDRIEPQVQRLKLCAGDRLLICSDGLTDMVDDATITAVMLENESAKAVCDKLIELALDGGGVDNVTVVVGRFFPPSHPGSS